MIDIADVTIPSSILAHLARRGSHLGRTAEQAARDYAARRSLTDALHDCRMDGVSVDDVANVIRIVADTGNYEFFRAYVARFEAAETERAAEPDDAAGTDDATDMAVLFGSPATANR